MIKLLIFLLSLNAHAVTKVKPYKIGADGIPSEVDTTTDYLAAKGIAFENSDSFLLDIDGSALSCSLPLQVLASDITFTIATLGSRTANISALNTGSHLLGILSQGHGAGVFPAISLLRSEGTETSPTVVTDGTAGSRIETYAYNGTSYEQTSRLVTDLNVSGSDVGADFQLFTKKMSSLVPSEHVTFFGEDKSTRFADGQIELKELSSVPTTTSFSGYSGIFFNSSGNINIINNSGTSFRLANVSSQAGDPTSTPRAVGDINVNTTSKKAFIAMATSSQNDWYQIQANRLYLVDGTNYTNRIKVTVPTSKIDADLTNFPVAVQLSDLGSTFFDASQNSGQDIVVTSSDGTTRLAVELKNVSTVTDSGQLYFKAASLSSSSATDFYIYVGNDAFTQPAANSTYGSQNVWNSNYQVVYHFEEDPSGSAPQILDSTSNARNGTSVGSMTSGDLVAGVFGNGLDFDGSNDYISVSSPSGILDDTQGLVSIFGKPVNITSTMVLVSSSVDGSFDDEFAVNFQGSVAGDPMRVNVVVNGAVTNQFDAGAFGSTSVFHGFAANSEGSLIRMYDNGLPQTITTNIGSNSGQWYASTTDSDFLAVGAVKRASPAGLYGGILDELRISNVARSSAYIKAEYLNISDPTTFAVKGSLE